MTDVACETPDALIDIALLRASAAREHERLGELLDTEMWRATRVVEQVADALIRLGTAANRHVMV